MINFNASNWTTDWMSLWTRPYVHILGDMFFVVLLLIICAGVYIGSDKDPLITASYCIVVACIFAIFGFMLTTLVLLIGGVLFAGIAYNAFVEKKRR